MPKVFTSETQKIGELGENIAANFLLRSGFSILERNYTRKYGEIDIVAKKNNKLHFVEVKTITRKIPLNPEHRDAYRPEDNMHPWKLKRLSRTIQSYILSHAEYDELDWQVDLLLVYLDSEGGKSEVGVESDIIL